MGYEGFSGNESILYHLHSPCRVAEVGDFEPIELEEWVPDAHVHRLTDTVAARAGRATRSSAASVLMFNDDVEMGDLQARRRADCLLPQRRGRRGPVRPRGLGRARDRLRPLPFGAARLRRDPARHDLPRRAGRRSAHVADVPHAGRDRDAEPLPQPLRAAARARAVLAARLPPARGARDAPRARRRTSSSCACAAATSASRSTTTRSTSSAGTATSTRTRSTSTTSSRSPAACTSRRRCTRPSRGRTS